MIIDIELLVESVKYEIYHLLLLFVLKLILHCSVVVSVECLIISWKFFILLFCMPLFADYNNIRSCNKIDWILNNGILVFISHKCPHKKIHAFVFLHALHPDNSLLV